MTTATDNQAFVDSLLSDVIHPGSDALMDSRYFQDLRAGKLTNRRMQGFAIQHYIHNMGVLKMAALGAVQHAANDKAFMAYGQLLTEEFTHPAMVKRFGISLGLTEEDFDRAQPVYGPMIHTAVCIAQIYLVSVIEMRANALSNETMVQRYATEFDDYLSEAPYNMGKKQRQFFLVHRGADVEHTARGAAAIVELAENDEDRQKVINVCKTMAKLKLGKFESIYDEYV
jgi:pyrroloquinoline quinone (PQQ) biosynthesis protein C